MSQISSDLVKKVAELARLELEDDEVGFYQLQFEKVLDYFGVLDQIDGLENNAEVCETPERSDTVLDQDFTEDAIRLAPKSTGTSFEVPKVIN